MKFTQDVKMPKNKEYEKQPILEEEKKAERKEMSPAELFLDDVNMKETDYEVKRGFMSSQLMQRI